MRILDKDRPYGQVFGAGGVFYEQDGFRFNAGGVLIPEEEMHLPEEPKEPEPDPDAIPQVLEQETPPAEEPSGGQRFEDMHWKALKVMVEAYGGEWVDKKEAVAFLKGQGA